MTGALDGLVVADFSRVLAGPLATTMLADLGATVIKVERPKTGDDTRHWGPPWTQDSSSYFECANRSKKSIELDLGDASDLGVAKDLARRADILVENFRDGTLARSGLDYGQVARDNPGIVYCSITGFGSRGGAHLPGYDFLVQALGGLMSITGAADGPPTKVGVALVDVLTSKDAVAGILAALHARHRSGRGQRVEVNLLSSLLGSLANQASSYLTTGNAPQRMGNRHPSIAPYESLMCKDGLLAVCCGNDAQFGRLVSEIGVAGLTDDPRFVTNERRVSNRADLIVVLESALSADTVGSWTERLTRVGVPAGKVGDIHDGIALAEALGLEPLIQLGAASPAQIRHPITYSDTPVDRYSAPPRLGADNEEVRGWLARGNT